MKQSLHPEYISGASIVCDACKTTYVAGSTRDGVHVEVCANCHPFYTGQSGMLVDTDNMVDKFMKRAQSADSDTVVRKRKKVQTRRAGSTTSEIKPEEKVTLRDMLKSLQA